MSTNDEVRVDIHEIENVETSPQEHDNVMDTTTASQNQPSKEEIVEITTSPPRYDQADGSKNGSFEEIGEDVTTKHGSFEEIEEHATSPPHKDQADYSKTEEDMNKLRRAALNNDWNTAYRDVFKDDPLKYSNYFSAPRIANGNTLLHDATEANSFLFVKEVVNYMTEDQLTIKNSYGNTAFFVAALYGRVEFAKVMFEKNEQLPSIRGNLEMLPIHVAAQNNHRQMAEFLYRIQGPLEEIDSGKLFLNVMDKVSLFGCSGKGKDIFEKLHQAATNDDWETARKVYKENPEYTKAIVSQEGDTALHIAVSSKFSRFAKNLVKKMKPKDLEIKNHDGNTAFHLAATLGNLELAKKMFDKNGKLRSIRGGKEMLPINVAAQSGHKEVVKFLYEDFISISNNEDKYLNEEDQCKLIHSLIRISIYDITLKLLKEKPELATCREEPNGETALHILARKPNFLNQNGSEKYKLVKCLWEKIRDLPLDEDKISEIIDHPWPVIFDAVEQQNVNFLDILIDVFPELILRIKGNNYSIFHVAVLKRQKEIFNLIHNIKPELKRSILEKEDDEKNNILHLVGMMPPQERLNNVLGVAIQLQQELFWFKEVEEIVDSKQAGAKNKEGRTPRDIHNKKITGLKDKGEKWMKEIANSCMIVATLITTVAFAAALTVPGGTKDDTGTPHFIQKVSFIIFVIADAIALASSSWSILTILSIYTTRYTDQEDFLVLPRNVVVGLSTLFLSVAAVMVVFCATIFIVFKDGKIWVPTLASMIASLPVISFTKQHQQLFYGVARLTFENSFLSKTIKKWKDYLGDLFFLFVVKIFLFYSYLVCCWYFPSDMCRACCNSFLNHCFYVPFDFFRIRCNRLLYRCRDMCSKDM